MRRHSGWIWGGRITAVVVLAGLTVYLASVGLDKADKLASVLSLLVAIAALIAPYLLLPSDGGRTRPKTVQQVANTVVSGHLTQVRDAKGMRVKGPVPAGPPQAPPPGGDPAPEGQIGQYVNGVWVGGNLSQVEGADGDITIE